LLPLKQELSKVSMDKNRNFLKCQLHHLATIELVSLDTVLIIINFFSDSLVLAGNPQSERGNRY
jgi:hypothetical protein